MSVSVKGCVEGAGVSVWSEVGESDECECEEECERSECGECDECECEGECEGSKCG